MSGHSAADLRARAWAGVAAQQRLFGEFVPGASVVRGDGWSGSLVPSAPDSALLNVAVPDAPTDDPPLTAVGATFGPHGVRWGVWVDSDAVGEGPFVAAGMMQVSTCAVMALELDGSHTAPAEPRVESTRDLRFVGALNDRAYGLADRRLERHFGGLPANAVHAHRIGRQSVAAAVDHDGDASLFFVATAPGRRRRGLGTSIVLGALAAATARGCSTASLLATPDGAGLYERLGFDSLGGATLWATRPRSRA